MNVKSDIILMTLLTASAWLLSACSADSNNEVSDTVANPAEITFNASVRQMAEGTRATTLDNSYLQTHGFRCTAYNANTTTVNTDVNISNNLVTWADSRWNFAGGSRYWPTTGNLDFYAYAPSEGSCITGLAYTYDSGQKVSFSCDDLPVTSGGQGSILEFVYALAAGQNKTNAASGVALNFVHPFTRIQLQLAAGHPDIHINTIKFKSIKNNGGYDGGVWTPSGDAVDFVWTFNHDYSYSASAQSLGDSYLVIPQSWEGVIEVNATWTVWGEDKTFTVSTDLAGTVTWAAGYSYTYTFTITETDLVVNTSKFTEQW